MKKLFFLALILTISLSMLTAANAGQLRKSVVSYHMSFDNQDFINEDFIQQSGKKTIEERKFDFPQGKFGKAVRMSFVPAPPDQHNMSGIDLDLITAVMFNTNPNNTMGYNEPFIWGSGRLNPRLGAVSLWAKGKPAYSGPLFEQTTIAFGRKERDLLGILINEDDKLTAYLRDARYERHEIESDAVWNADTWNHVVLNWDWAKGMELWLNGEKIASSMGSDAWFETLLPGLFHLPTPGVAYDELYLMDRPLSKSEISKLMKSNTPPKSNGALYKRKSADVAMIDAISGADKIDKLPTVQAGQGMTIKEVYPTNASDGNVPGWYVIDGRNEMAWPHEYAFFTIIPGDADFHAEKVDLPTKATSKVNYVTVTGNLTNVKVQSGPSCMSEVATLFEVPAGKQFFHGAQIPAQEGATFRIPFTERYGAPDDYEGDVYRLPVSGEKRIHNVGLYYTSEGAKTVAGEPRTIWLADPNFEDRYDFAVHALTARDERQVALASPMSKGSGRKSVSIGAFQRLNIMTEPIFGDTGVTKVKLSIPVKTARKEEALFVRVHDAAVPSRLWNQFAVKLDGFDKDYKMLELVIDFHDLVLTGGDRLWIDLGTSGDCQVRIGDRNNPAELTLETVASYITADAWADKEMISAKAQYSKQYEFLPWQFTGREVDLDKPYCYGGPFDVYLPAQAVKRVLPDHFIANFFELMSGPDYDDGHPTESFIPQLVTLDNPLEAPDWALYMHDYNIKRHSLADWWVKRQNPDGQMGGGWNDDTLFMSFHQADLPLDGNMNAKAIIDTVHTKFEATGLFKDGYCRIYPIDRMHTGDFISERYNTVVNNLGQAYPAEREMESAWRLDKPDETPINYAEGLAFMSSVNVFRWYWNEEGPEEAYSSPSLNDLADEFRLSTTILDDFYYYRMTESNVHRDDFMPRGQVGRRGGAPNMYKYMLGGVRGARWDAHLKLSVMWPFGGGPDVARVIMNADDTSIKVAAYSFDNRKRDLGMRLCRINDGLYKITIHADPQGNGNAGKVIWQSEQALRLFDTISLPIPPKTPVVITVEQTKAHDRPAALADLTIDPWDVKRDGSSVTVTVHNLGNSAANNVAVRLVSGDKTLAEQSIATLDAPTDFVAKRAELTFRNITDTGNLRVIVDPDNTIREILEENNERKLK